MLETVNKCLVSDRCACPHVNQLGNYSTYDWDRWWEGLEKIPISQWYNNSVTHLCSYTDTTISSNSMPWADIATPSADVALLSADVTAPSTNVAALSTDVATPRASRLLHQMASVWVFHDISQCFTSVSCFTSSLVVRDVLRVFMMFHKCFMMFYDV